jgi:hypothetical protein
MSREHLEGCIPSRIMSPWLSSALDESAIRIISLTVWQFISIPPRIVATVAARATSPRGQSANSNARASGSDRFWEIPDARNMTSFLRVVAQFRSSAQRWAVVQLPTPNEIVQPSARANGDQLMSREHQQGCISSRIMSPWLSSALGT